MSATILTHRPQPIIPTDSYSETIRSALAGRPAAQPDAEPPRRSRIRFEVLHRLSRYIRDNARLVIFAGTLGFVAWAILAVIIMTRDVPQQPTYRQGGGAVMVLHAAPIVRPADFTTFVTVTSVSTVTSTATPQAVASVPSTLIAVEAGKNLPACITVSDMLEIQHTAQGEAISLHSDAAMYFVMGQMLFDKERTNCQPLYRWLARDGAQAQLPIKQSTMDTFAKVLTDYPAFNFGYCPQVGSDDDYNNVWLPQRIAGKLPKLALSFTFGSGDGSSAELAFNCAEPLGK